MAGITNPAPIRHSRSKIVKIHQWGAYEGIVDPWVMQVNGKYIMYRCQNSANRDRVWRMESDNGITNWTNNQIVLEGGFNNEEGNPIAGGQDDLSCSPGVVIAPNGLWHMYYITGPRGTPEQMCGRGAIEMWHATSFDGIAWNKQGKIQSLPLADCSLLEPSPIIEGNTIGVYFVAGWFRPYDKVRLWRIESDIEDGHLFTSPSPAGRIAESRNGRVSKFGSTYYFVYSNVTGGEDTQTNELRMSSGPSADFTEGRLLLQITPGTFYSTFLSGSNYIPNRIYITGDSLPLCKTGQTPGIDCSDGYNVIGVIKDP